MHFIRYNVEFMLEVLIINSLIPYWLKISAENVLKSFFFFSYYSQKISFDISCKLSFGNLPI